MKKKRKRIAGNVPQDASKDNCYGSWYEREYDDYMKESLGQTVKDGVQNATRLIYVSGKKESECSNNWRQHYCTDGKEKIAYGSLSEARAACAAMWNKNEDMYPYKCTYCNQYHIGHKWGAGHSIAYNFYKGGEVAGLLIDLAFTMKRLFAKDNRDYPYLPPYDARNTKG